MNRMIKKMFPNDSKNSGQKAEKNQSLHSWGVQVIFAILKLLKLN